MLQVQAQSAKDALRHSIGAESKLAGATFDGLEKSNLFDLLRFMAASLVIYSHSFPLLGLGSDWLCIVSGMNFGTLGVCLFFTLSGFLITRSWLNSSSPVSYLAARSLRIFPGLAVSLFFCVFLVGPLCTSLPLREYFGSSQTYYFLTNLILFPIRYQLPGVFSHNPYPDAVNGSLWSLPIEFLMYIVVMVAGAVGVLKRRWLLLLLTLALSAFDYLIASRPPYCDAITFTLPVGASVNMAVYFLTGGVIYLFRDRIPSDWRIAVTALFLWLMDFRRPEFRFYSYVALPYVFFFVASLPLPPLRRFARFGDFSYGLYVFAFPVQQALVHFMGPEIGVPGLSSISFLVTVLLAVLSWHLVERPCLKLKARLKGPVQRAEPRTCG